MPTPAGVQDLALGGVQTTEEPNATELTVENVARNYPIQHLCFPKMLGPHPGSRTKFGIRVEEQ